MLGFLRKLVLLSFLLPLTLVGAEGNFCSLSFVKKLSLDQTISNPSYLFHLASETKTTVLIPSGRDLKSYSGSIKSFRKKVSRIENQKDISVSEKEHLLAKELFQFLIETRNFKANRSPGALNWKAHHIKTLAQSIKETLRSNELNLIEKTIISLRKSFIGLFRWTYRYGPSELKMMEESLYELQSQLQESYKVDLSSYSKKQHILRFLGRTVSSLLNVLATTRMGLHRANTIYIPNKLYTVTLKSIVDHLQWTLRITYFAALTAFVVNPELVGKAVDALRALDPEKVMAVAENVKGISPEGVVKNGELIYGTMESRYLELVELEKLRELTSEEKETLETYKLFVSTSKD